MRRKIYSPVVKVQENSVTRIMNQIYKLPNGEKYLVKFDEVSLLLQENKLINSLSPDDIRYLLETVGNNSPSDSSKQLDDDTLLEIVNSRRLQEPSLLKRHLESAFAAYKDGKQTYEQALKSFKEGSYLSDEKEDSKTD